MTYRSPLIAGILFAGLAVMIGAFGAHGLKEILQTTGRAETFELAVRYQFYHAFALLFTGILTKQDERFRLKWAVIFFSIGILLFSGSLYILSVTGITILGAVTPFGGVCFIIGWIIFLINILKYSKNN